ncbi:hypothetical protein [Paludibacterium yongneupense]|uniref:hypothetical protein n=1 Tax=Paludibacterium yongneupense TaxID=400061 RepID=UPI00040C51FC|nr:hypothetical protein [Paludibacterium yongneupense]
MQQASHALTRYFGPSDHAGTVSLESFRRRAKRHLSIFDELVRRQLKARGIGIPPAINLVSCPQSTLTVEGEHPQREAILDWLRQDVKINKKFKEVEVLFEIIRAAETPDSPVAMDCCFHVGLTSAGPVAFFDILPCDFSVE